MNKARLTYIENVQAITKDTGVSYKCYVPACPVIYIALNKMAKDKYKKEGEHRH